MRVFEHAPLFNGDYPGGTQSVFLHLRGYRSAVSLVGK
jgi:hypothetical protein